MAISLLFNRYCIVSFKFPPRRPSPQASKRFLVQSLARFGLQNGFWCNPRHVSGFKTVFGAILGTFRAPKRFLVQSLARFGLQNGFWCNPRHVSGFETVFGQILGEFYGIRVGAQQPTPHKRPDRDGCRTYLFGPTGGVSWGRMQGSPLHTGTRQTSQPRQRPPGPAGPPPRTTHTPKAARASVPSM